MKYSWLHKNGCWKWFQETHSTCLLKVYHLHRLELIYYIIGCTISLPRIVGWYAPFILGSPHLIVWNMNEHKKQRLTYGMLISITIHRHSIINSYLIILSFYWIFAQPLAFVHLIIFLVLPFGSEYVHWRCTWIRLCSQLLLQYRSKCSFRLTLGIWTRSQN